MKIIFRMSLFLLVCSCAMTSHKTEKINGVSFVASRDTINDVHIKPLLNIHANYAAIMPFGFIRELSHPEIVFNTERQWFGERAVGVKQYAENMKKNQIKVMLKPQIWVSRGAFTGGIKMTSEADWQVLEDSYTSFILTYAKLAQELQTEIFCIGTELESFIDERPEYWKQLIVNIKKVYKGKLTYAANWNEYDRTPFWDPLDYIGIDAYFPVSDEKTPTVEACRKGWLKHKPTIKSFSERYKKPILFTEVGYRSVDFSGKEPWRSDRDMTVVNLEAQTNTMQVLFEVFWNEDEDWFAGGFLWKWFHNHKEAGGENDSRFTPQNKPVETLVKAHYSK
ncbi:glycoside hydrolase [Mariniflexile litorale]|uniref:Glycoside hydrolase n=1 Tax=Mariniflexile litorale TaxID=3045158 RepID=A0AAU7EBI0_9FLAO|nr:glycoside hydrolase [Mariniflexile sp. KMM 9835]MDQ8210486.1 glycoside hydrolase [Mariniflexile sp. KMM 9835]